MSRLGAALERAKTGSVQPAEEQRPPALVVEPMATEPMALEPMLVEPMLVEPMVVDEEAGAEAPPEVEDQQPSELERPRFRSFNRKYAEKLVVSSTMASPLREQYRRLAATLHHAQGESGIKTLMVTSAVSDEGKTLTAANIALTLSESYQRRVLLLDADLRRPSLGDMFQLPNVYGLSEALSGKQERGVSIIQISQWLSLLTAGAPDHDPMSKLTSDRMFSLLEEAKAAFDWVIIDTPPIGILTDATLLGAMADAALLVVRAGRTPAPLVQRAVDALGRNRVIGVVLNRAEPGRTTGAGESYDFYHYGSKGRL
ncbi:MAG: CpsD/CapB family tyrosine-protein kinase [Vicinamibacterales bacterium]